MKNKVPDSACGLPDIKNLKYEYLGIFDTVRMGTQRSGHRLLFCDYNIKKAP